MKSWKKLVAVCAVAILSITAGQVVKAQLGERGITTPSVSAENPGCADLIKGFDNYALVYPGDEFEGVPLTDCWFVGDDGLPRFGFVYGCTIVDNGETESCSADLQITVFSNCAPALADEVKEIARDQNGKVKLDKDGKPLIKEQAKIREAKTSRKEGGDIYLEGVTMKVMISSGKETDANKAKVERAAKKLKGANALAAGFDENSSFLDEGKLKLGKGPNCK